MTRHNSSVNNGSGVYKLFGSRERYTVAPTMPGGDIAFTKQSSITHQSIYGQRGRTQAIQEANVPQKDPAHGASTPSYQGISGGRIPPTHRDSRQREPFRYSDEGPSDEERARMDQQKRDRLENITGREWDQMDEWVSKEVMEEWLKE